jgi:hypothetical protein
VPELQRFWRVEFKIPEFAVGSEGMLKNAVINPIAVFVRQYAGNAAPALCQCVCARYILVSL